MRFGSSLGKAVLLASMLCILVLATIPARFLLYSPFRKRLEPAGVTNTAPEISLSLWHIQIAGDGPELIGDSVSRFIEQYPHIHVEVTPYQNDPYKVKLMVAMGTRNPPDIFSSWSGGPLYEYVRAGQVADLTDMFERDVYRDYFLEPAVSMVTFGDRIWGVPVENVSVAVILYNKELFERYRIEVPETYSELLEAAARLKSHGVIPFALANRTKWPASIFFMYMVDRLAGPELFMRAASRKGATFEDPAFIKAGEMVQDLVRMGAFGTNFNALDFDSGHSRSMLYAGTAAMELMGTWNISTIKAENPEFYENNLGFFPFPRIEGGLGDPASMVGTVGDNFYSISSTCPYPEEAFRLIQFLIDEKAVEKRGAAGRIPPVRSFRTEDPMLQGLLELLRKSPSVQLWYDQYLPPELGEVHKDIMQELFGLQITPEEAAAIMEDRAVKFFN